MTGTLYIVSTPIGNLSDMTCRAVETLRTVSLIVAEDTRHSRALLDHYDIRTSTASYHEHNEARETPKLLARLQGGESIALISDAGTPLVSDPGARLVRACIGAQVPVVPIPGASALLAAFVASGLVADRFAFYGFLDRKGKTRTSALAEIVRSPMPVVIYESPNRVSKTLQELAAAGAAERQVVIARELTKRFEEFRRGTVATLAAELGDDAMRGEVVLVIDGATALVVTEEEAGALVQQWRAEGGSARDITERLMQEHGIARNVAYRLARTGEEPPET